jgi:phosphate-selective porin OprO/OprP
MAWERKRLQVVHLLGVCLLLASGRSVRGQDPGADQRGPAKSQPSIQLRLERLEKQNEALAQQNEHLLKLIERLEKQQATAGSAESAPGAVSKQDVQQIVTEYLQAQEKKQDPATQPKAPAPPAAPTWYQVGSDAKMSASWKNGLVLESAQKDFRMNIGGRINQDWGWFDQSQNSRDAAGGGSAPALGTLQDGTNFRRGRVSGSGTFSEIFEWAVEWEFSGSSDVFWDDLWFGVTGMPIIGSARMGHIKVPMGFESNMSSRYLTFLERGLIFEAFFEEYDPGIVILNNAFDQRMGWQAAFHRIDPEGEGIDYGTGDYAGTGRVTFLPYWADNGRCWAHLGASAQYRSGEFDTVSGERLQRYRTRPPFRNRQASYPRFVDTGVLESDHADIVGLEAAFTYGPLSIQAEYAHNWVNDARQPVGGAFQGDLHFQGYYVFVSYFLTGEHRPYDKRLGRVDRAIPLENFFWVKGENGGRHLARGAWEVCARYDYVDLSDNGVRGGTLHDWTFGLNWYWNPNMRWMLNYIIADRNVDAPGNGDAVKIVALRFHYDF